MDRRVLLALAVGCVIVTGVANADIKIADEAVTGRVTVTGISWNFPNGRIDWRFDPTKLKGPFNQEWTWQLNRMYFWGDMAEAYKQTKDEKYAKAFAQQASDFFDQVGEIPPETDYNVLWSTWRTIEEGLRLNGSWKQAWRAFSSSPAFTEELKARFKRSMYAQARHLLAHSTACNWLEIEMLGVYSFALEFSEYEDSEEMRREAVKRMFGALKV